MHILPLVFTLGLAFLVPALLPGFKLCHDRVFCAYDLERLDRPHWQREPDRGGAEVGSARCLAAVTLLPETEEQCCLSKSLRDSQRSVFSLGRLLEFSLLIPVFISFWPLLKHLTFFSTHFRAFIVGMLMPQYYIFAFAF